MGNHFEGFHGKPLDSKTWKRPEAFRGFCYRFGFINALREKAGPIRILDLLPWRTGDRNVCFHSERSNPQPECKRERIFAIIWAESYDLSNEFESSITDTQRNNVYEILIKSPDGNRVARNFQCGLGYLPPAIFRLRLRELFKLL